ncbi:M15 family metallopeptidase [Paenibacillus aurantius]|uniref:M15 family metallopeptidase n=1 Tax=Paenibacillus aurantius TaxID=2918900 RepID=A0AA96RDJ4_9BACL|nr:M15 family metallopeptidase [Paenibacillus aurantius]WNQ09491.1 M15 family metallopeptidase [Paenibacillus aurantius]
MKTNYSYARQSAPALARKAKKRSIFLLALMAAAGILLLRPLPLADKLLPDWGIESKKNVPPVDKLHPVVAAKQAELEAAARKAGIPILITDGLRTVEEQNALYRKGREDGGSVVTQVQGGDSYHNYGLAVDFALKTKDGKVLWDLKYDGNRNGKADWMEVVALAKGLGFSWGGDWSGFPDYPHLQMDFGYSIRELKRGARPPETASP